jgi:hypothetical protein
MAQFVGAPVEFEIITKPDYVRRHKDQTNKERPPFYPESAGARAFPPQAEMWVTSSGEIQQELIRFSLLRHCHQMTTGTIYGPGPCWDASKSSDFQNKAAAEEEGAPRDISGPNGLTEGNHNTERPGEESSSRVEWYPRNAWELGQNGIPSGR